MIDIYLCDDDASARRRIQTILEKKILIEDYDMRVVCSADSAETLLMALGDRRQNIYLLDVELKDGQWDGFLLGRELRRRDPRGTLIYITSYGDLAPRTFQYHLEVFDYIVKTPDRLEESICRCLEAFQNRLLLERPTPVQVYTLQTGSSLRHIPMNEILFFETAPRSHHVLLHTLDSRMDFLGSLNEIQASLGERFFRSHRAYLVAFDKIQRVDLRRGQLLVGERECLLSRTAGRELRKRMDANRVPFGNDLTPFEK